MSKEFKNYAEQIELLKNKNLIINDEEYAITLLKKHSYFDLINGYKYPFKNKDGLYKKNTKIEDIYFLYCFDDRLRYLLLKYIMKIEIHIKSLLSYSFSESYGNSESAYLDATNYDYSNPSLRNGINKLISKLTETLDDSNSFRYMKHQREKHNNVPIWVIVKALTFGNISRMYSFLKPEIKTKISKEFFDVNEGDLISFLDLLSRFRNVCAHNERLFDYKYKKHIINDTKIHHALNIKKQGNLYIQGKSDLFAVIISLKYLLSEYDFCCLIDEIDESIKILFENTNQIQKNQLYKYMGFPENWRKIRDMKTTDIVIKKYISN